jgi:site-specific DNA recombinase
LALRNPINTKAKHIDRKRNKRGGHTPYGFAYLDGQLVIDPREHLVVRQIMRLHQEGKSSQAIADELNRQKVPTRLRVIWRKCVVLSIIRRQKDNK